MSGAAGRAAALRDGLLFAAAGVIPAIFAVALGLRAVRNEEAALRREAAVETDAAARSAAARLRAAIDEAAARLVALPLDRSKEADAAERRRLAQTAAPRWAEPVVLDARLEAIASDDTPARLASAAAPQRGAAACRSTARRVLDGEEPTRALDRCDDARTELGRWLVPMTLLAVLQQHADERAAELLVAWLDARAARMDPAEREATREEIGSSRMPAEGAARALAALDRDGSASLVGAAVRSDAARAAFARGADGDGLIRWGGDGALGVVRPESEGGALGFVVDVVALERALAEHDEAGSTAIHAVVADPAPSAAPRAVSWLAPGLGIEATLRGGDDLAARSRRARWLLWSIAGGSASVALLFAVVLFARLRAARRTSELRTTFAAAVSHELRTPIASIRMLAELLEGERGGDEAERRETASAIARESRRLGETVSRLLAWSRMTQGQVDLIRRQVALADVVGDAVDVFEERTPGVVVERALDGAIVLAADAPLVQLAVMNLLDNARRHAPEGGPYRVVVAAAPGGARVEVHDRGPGVPRALRARIFEAFERGDARLSRAVEGTGIGLALVRAVARAHGGDAHVEDAEGGGATFVIALRADRGEDTR